MRGLGVKKLCVTLPVMPSPKFVSRSEGLVDGILSWLADKIIPMTPRQAKRVVGKLGRNGHWNISWFGNDGQMLRSHTLCQEAENKLLRHRSAKVVKAMKMLGVTCPLCLNHR